MLHTLRRRWYIVLLVVVLIATLVLRSLTPKTVPIQVNTFQKITPGYSTEQDILSQFGQPLQKTMVNNQTIYDYKSAYPSQPREFGVQDQKVTYIKDRLSPSDLKTQTDFIRSLGAPDAIAYTSYNADIFPLSVFVSKGLAAGVGSGGEVFEVWYFQPMTIDQFFSTVGKGLSREPPGPEIIEVQTSPSPTSASKLQNKVQ